MWQCHGHSSSEHWRARMYPWCQGFTQLIIIWGQEQGNADGQSNFIIADSAYPFKNWLNTPFGNPQDNTGLTGDCRVLYKLLKDAMVIWRESFIDKEKWLWGNFWWHISVFTCQIIMSTCPIFMLTCQLCQFVRKNHHNQ